MLASDLTELLDVLSVCWEEGIDGPRCQRQVQKSGNYTCDKKEKIQTSKKKIPHLSGLITW